jgi:hypothetical protein
MYPRPIERYFAPTTLAQALQLLGEHMGEANNVLDFKYQTAGVLGEDFFTGPNFSYNTSGTPTVFSTPGAPFGIWIGVRYDFGRSATPSDKTRPY